MTRQDQSRTNGDGGAVKRPPRQATTVRALLRRYYPGWGVERIERERGFAANKLDYQISKGIAQRAPSASDIAEWCGKLGIPQDEFSAACIIDAGHFDHPDALTVSLSRAPQLSREQANVLRKYDALDDIDDRVAVVHLLDSLLRAAGKTWALKEVEQPAVGPA